MPLIPSPGPKVSRAGQLFVVKKKGMASASDSMKHPQFVIAAVMGVLLAVNSAGQARPEPEWETLVRAPLPEGSEPKVSVTSFSFGPAPAVQRPVGAGHTHLGPVFGYILQGEIENQIEPDSPEVYKPDEFFHETPGSLHRFLRNNSRTEQSRLITFSAGQTRKADPAVPAIKELLEAPLVTTVNQEVSLLRLTLRARTSAEILGKPNPGIIYVLDGTIEATGTDHSTKSFRGGDLFVNPANGARLTLKNASAGEPARALLYQVSENNVAGSESKRR